MSSSGSTNGFTLVIQAGGESRRMGHDKALMTLAGKPLIQHVIDNLAPLHADETLVITRAPERYTHLPLTVCRDLIPDCGPLGGLYTALTLAQHDMVAVIGCDMPFAEAAVFTRLRDALANSNAHAAAPRWQDQPEPLHAVYHRRALPIVKEYLGRGDYSMMSLLQRLDTTYLDVNDGLPFTNVNTPDQLAAASSRLVGERA